MALKQTQKAKRSYYGGFWNVCGEHRNLVISPSEIKGGKNFLSRKNLRTILDVRQRVTIWHSHGIKAPVVTARSPVPTLFLDHVQRTCPWTARRTDYALLNHKLEFFLSGF